MKEWDCCGIAGKVETERGVCIKIPGKYIQAEFLLNTLTTLIKLHTELCKNIIATSSAQANFQVKSKLYSRSIFNSIEFLF